MLQGTCYVAIIVVLSNSKTNCNYRGTIHLSAFEKSNHLGLMNLRYMPPIAIVNLCETF